jgi:5-formyltetrahydrofolate cyclo-ligase
MDDTARASIRRELRARRAALPPAERIAAAEGLAARLEELAEWHVDQRIAGYWAIHGEMLLHRAAAACERRRAQWHLPRLDGNTLRFAPWRVGDPLSPNDYGIPEPAVPLAQCLAPEALELVLVPLVAFDRRGGRLGAGAGFYDRAFAFLKHGERPREPLLVGVGFAFQEVESLPPAAWDVRLDFVCTEKELIDCSGESEGRASN